MLTSLFSLFYVTGEFHRFLHRSRTQVFNLCVLASLFGQGFDAIRLVSSVGRASVCCGGG